LRIKEQETHLTLQEHDDDDDDDLHLWTFKFRIFILSFTKEQLFNVKISHLLINSLFFENHITMRPMDKHKIRLQPRMCTQRWLN